MKKGRRGIHMIAYLLLDMVLAAGIVYGYYWGTFVRAQKPGFNGSQITITNPNKEQTADSGEGLLSSEDAATDKTAEQTQNAAVSGADNDGRGESGDNNSESNYSDSNDSGSSASLSGEETSAEAGTEETTIEKPGIERLTWTEKFIEHFTEEPVVTENGYSDQHVSVTITKWEEGSGKDKITYYVADLYVAAIEYFGAGIYNDDGTFQWTTTAIQYGIENPSYKLITNGDYCGYNRQGLIIRNGKVYRNDAYDVELCVLRYDGTMDIWQPNTYTLEMAQEEGVWQTWCFGPSLLDAEGQAKEDFLINSYLRKSHPRTAIGYYEPGHYCMVVIDGREDGYSRGMNLEEMSQLFAELGCQAAYNLDGGGSSVMVYDKEAVNHSTERYISDFVVLSTEPLSASE